MLKTTSYPDAVIEMQNVGIRYGQGAEVLSDIKLSLKRGSFHFLTGKSGAGKTSLLSMMYLAQKPSRGIVSVFGKNVNFTNRDSLAMLRRKIGVVFQDFRLLEHLSAFDNVALPLRVCGMEEKEVKKRVTELLQWVELDKHIKNRPLPYPAARSSALPLREPLSTAPNYCWLTNQPVTSITILPIS